ncbi:UNVERIFIED_CONTAM: hypothetical protein NCL1_34454 [Trichonephila clavipes]
MGRCGFQPICLQKIQEVSFKTCLISQIQTTLTVGAKIHSFSSKGNHSLQISTHRSRMEHNKIDLSDREITESATLNLFIERISN